MVRIVFLSLVSFVFGCAVAQPIPDSEEKSKRIGMGAEQTQQYFPQLKGKNVGLVVNLTSRVGEEHLLDFLLGKKIKVLKIFSPEHGFRGDADAGEKVLSTTDAKTGLPVISLYGDNKKPKKEQLEQIDVLIFDIQDVGARFYTYLSTLHYLMEACAENNKKLIVLDRPNPNGDYVDGPVLEKGFTSFVGLHPIPIVHGMTLGELALMINGEKWLKDSLVCDLMVSKCKNYSHTTSYTPPVKPSPNLPNLQSIRLYPSLCLFEGTKVSVGRGTEMPFQVIGIPDSLGKGFSFTPKSIPGMAKKPMYEGMVCYGKDLRTVPTKRQVDLSYVMGMYQASPQKEAFFIPFFNKLAGNVTLQEQIKSGLSEEAIRQSWQPGLELFKQKRKKYMLYSEGE
jgi:uncharacterized protein YbbC (DUF1343 family)